MRKLFILYVICQITSTAMAQETSKLEFHDAASKESIPSVIIKENNKVLGISDALGVANIILSKGNHELSFSSMGYKNTKLDLHIPINGVQLVELSASENALGEVSVVASTRNNQNIENSPLKVEILGKEEMDEENTIKPGNIASILGDISGVQIQQSSPTSGNASVRIQGLDGRYTQILRDGMPLYDGFSGGFGILSIPPLDLKQLELIKGSASTLYGGGAIGGLINIISKTPTANQEGIFTVNQSTLQETNFNTFLSKKYNNFGYTFFGGITRQKQVDVNKDGLSDVAALNAYIIHPRLFWYLDESTTLTTGYTGTFENRKGGDMQVLDGKTDAIHQYFEYNKTTRHSGELLLERKMANDMKLEFKNSLSSFDRNINSNTHFFSGNQLDYFSELSLLVPYQSNSFVGGLNVTGNRFTKQPSDIIPLPNFSNNLVGAFVQHTWNIKDKLVLEGGLRDDYHLTYGNFLLPRVALFYRFDKQWAMRSGVGMGYKTPNPLAAQLVDYSIENLQALPNTAKAEKSTGYNLEGNYKMIWDNGNTFFINHAFFLTQVTDPFIATEQTNGMVSFSNASASILTKGFDTYIKAVVSEWELYVGYTYTLAERKYLAVNQFMPLTPKDRFAFTLVRDIEELGFRFGLEGSYNGSQYRMDGSKTPGYLFTAAMIEKKFGKHFSVVLNGENLLDYRQSNIESLYTGTITNPKFNALWAPIDGRAINVSVKYKL